MLTRSCHLCGAPTWTEPTWVGDGPVPVCERCQSDGVLAVFQTTRDARRAVLWAFPGLIGRLSTKGLR